VRLGSLALLRQVRHIVNHTHQAFIYLHISYFCLPFLKRVATVTGPFVVMIYKMVIGDILTFSSIYSLLLFGFSSGKALTFFCQLEKNQRLLFGKKITFYYIIKGFTICIKTVDLT
jgi:hypothetical protein